MCRAPFHFLHLSFLPPVPYPPLRGTFSSRGRLCPSLFFFSHMRVFALMLWGEAVFSYRSLPHWGRGNASAVDRVLSYNACLRRIFHLFPLSFMPLEPYPADDTRETCHPQTFGHRPIYICGEAATTTLNPEPRTLKKSCQAKPLDKSIFLLYNNIRCGDELCLLKTS